MQVLCVRAPDLCLVALDRRAYDTTDFVERHPGGSHLMLKERGRDVSQIFDAFHHSLRAHDLMRTQMLRFDGVAFSGGPGAPWFARAAAPQAWSVHGEARMICDWMKGGCESRWQQIQALGWSLRKTEEGPPGLLHQLSAPQDVPVGHSRRANTAYTYSYTVAACALAIYAALNR